MAVKKKSIVVYLFLAALIAGGVYLYFNANSLIINTTQRIASNALGVPVKIGSINLSLADRSVTLNTLKIGNPPGYQEPNIIIAKSISVGLNTASKQFIDFKNIEVKGVEVFFELTPQGTNLTDLKKLAAGKKQTASAGSEAVRVIIQKMVIDASVIHPSVAMLKGVTIPAVTTPALNLSGIGQKSGGSDASAVITQVITQYLSEAQKALNKSGALKNVPDIGSAKRLLDDKTKLLNDRTVGKFNNLF